jgi:hypothetical protein
MYSDIVNALDDNRKIGVVFLDVKAAYDDALVNILI